MECKHCGFDFHYCGSCDSEYHLDEGYCSVKCWNSSKEYNEMKDNFLKFYNSLDNVQQNYFINEENPINNCSYEWELEKWIGDIKNEV
jgi:hypothetical protein